MNIELAEVFYSEVVAVLIEVCGVMRLPVNRLGRAQRVRKRHCAQPGLPHESGIVVLLLGHAIDLQVDFTDGFAPSLAALSGRQCLGVENDLHSVLPSAVPSGRTAIWRCPVANAGLAEGGYGLAPRRPPGVAAAGGSAGRPFRARLAPLTSAYLSGRERQDRPGAAADKNCSCARARILRCGARACALARKRRRNRSEKV